MKKLTNMTEQIIKELERFDVKDFLKQSYINLLEAQNKGLEKMKKEEKIIESCDNCGSDGYGRAWYGRGRPTGDAWGDRYEATGSIIFCKDCKNDFRIGSDYYGEEIWKTTSDREEHNAIRLAKITKTDKEAVGFNQALQQIIDQNNLLIEELKKDTSEEVS